MKERGLAKKATEKNSAAVFPSAGSLKVAIIVSQWHQQITDSLFDSALAALLKNGCRRGNISRYDVPGSFEILFAAKEAAQTNVDAIICFGCLVKGDTPHFDLISTAVTNGIANLNLTYNIPFIFGVLTTHTLKQAQDRVNGKVENKGEDCAVAMLQMVELKKKFKTSV